VIPRPRGDRDERAHDEADRVAVGQGQRDHPHEERHAEVGRRAGDVPRQPQEGERLEQQDDPSTGFGKRRITVAKPPPRKSPRPA